MNKDENQVMVTILCLAYNHAAYIRQCLEGFVMQKTDFCFEAIVHDDASTDGTAAIIKEYADKYPDIIKPVFETENQYSKHDGTIGRVMRENMHGKYVAMCEGDDYWIDPLKLQKQVDFLESHPDYGLVHTDFDIINEGSIKEYRVNRNVCERNDVLNQILIGNYNIGTLTVVFRTDLYRSLPRYDRLKNYPMGDLPLWIELASISRFKYLKDVTACYRRLNESASHSTNFAKRMAFIDALFDCRIFYMRKFNLLQLEKLIYKNHLLVKLKVAATEHRQKESILLFLSLFKQCDLNALLRSLYYISVAYFPSIPKIISYFR